MSLFHFLRNRSSFNPFVVSVTLSFVLLVIGIALLIPQQAETVLNAAKTGIFKNFSWFYILAFSAFFFFLLALSVSSFGNIKLGSNEEEPEFSFWSWLAMLFAAGMGVGLMFFGVAEPLTHYLSPITEGGSGARQQDALLHTLFHWGVHAWSVYAAMALALAYFAFRYKLPLSLRSCFYPLLKEKIDGKAGDIIDILALVATLFGIITTLGFGAAQLGAGLAQIGWISENTFSVQTIVIFAVMGLAVASAASGIGKGVKMLSEMNLTLAFVLMVFVLATGPTLHLLSAFNDNLGTYLSNLVQLSFKTYSYEQNHTEWFGGWTILYWAWGCSWAPFVGLFIARISRGRTIRQFVTGVMFVPSVVSLIWFAIFGGGAIGLQERAERAGRTADALVHLKADGTPDVNFDTVLFDLLNAMPVHRVVLIVLMVLAVVLVAIFFVTGADSASIVMGGLSEKGAIEPSRFTVVFWGVATGGVASAMLLAGGDDPAEVLTGLRDITIVSALPFVFVMLLLCVSLYKDLNNDPMLLRHSLANQVLVDSVTTAVTAADEPHEVEAIELHTTLSSTSASEDKQGGCGDVGREPVPDLTRDTLVGSGF